MNSRQFAAAHDHLLEPPEEDLTGKRMSWESQSPGGRKTGKQKHTGNGKKIRS